MSPNSPHWIDHILAASDPERAAREVVAARVVAGIETERGRPFRSPNRTPGHANEFSGTNMTLIADVDPFSGDPFNATSVHYESMPLGITEVTRGYGLDAPATDMMRVAADNMLATALRTERDRDNLGLQDLSRMPQKELYLLMERKGNAERQQRLALAHIYTGEHRFHPYLGNEPAELLLMGSHATTTTRSTRAPTRDVPDEILGGANGGLILHPQSRAWIGGLGPLRRHMKMWPTTSTRTLYDPRNDIHVKTSFDAVITSAHRGLPASEGKWGVGATELLFRLHDMGKIPKDTYVLPELRWLSNEGDIYANAIVRGGLQDIMPEIDPTDRVIPAAALTTRLPFANNKTLLDLLIAQNGPGFYATIAEKMIQNHLRLANVGIHHESHGQNTLLIFNEDFTRIKGICIRDLPSISVDVDRLAAHNYHLVGDEPWFRVAGQDTVGRTALFTRCVLDGQVALAGARLITLGTTDAEAFARMTRDIIQSELDLNDYDRTWLENTFYRANSTSAMLTRTQSPVRPTKNELWGEGQNIGVVPAGKNQPLGFAL